MFHFPLVKYFLDVTRRTRRKDPPHKNIYKQLECKYHHPRQVIMDTHVYYAHSIQCQFAHVISPFLQALSYNPILWCSNYTWLNIIFQILTSEKSMTDLPGLFCQHGLGKLVSWSIGHIKYGTDDQNLLGRSCSLGFQHALGSPEALLRDCP